MVSFVQMEKVSELINQGYTPANEVAEKLSGGVPIMGGPSYLNRPDGSGVVMVDSDGEVTEYVDPDKHAMPPVTSRPRPPQP